MPGNTRSRKTRAVAAIVSHTTIAAAAAAIGADESTVRRWLRNDPEFAAAVADARASKARELLDGIAVLSPEIVGQALKGLIRLAEDRTTPPAVRARCYVALIDVAFSRVELTALQAQQQADRVAMAELREALERRAP